MDTALLLLDLQEGLCRTDGVVGGPSGLGAQVVERDVLGNAARCLTAARAADVLVIHSRVAFDAAYVIRTNRTGQFAQIEENGLLSADSAEAAICPEVAPAAGEAVLDRGGVNPFIASPMAEILIARRVSRVFIAGVATNFVVESAARHAGDSGFETIVIDDACASYTAEMHGFAIEATLPLWADCVSSGDAIARL
jgi:biuret amidohydrolase